MRVRAAENVGPDNSITVNFGPSVSGLALSGHWLFVVRFCQVLHFQFSEEGSDKTYAPTYLGL